LPHLRQPVRADLARPTRERPRPLLRYAGDSRRGHPVACHVAEQMRCHGYERGVHMASDNSVTFVGQLTTDPELRHTKKKVPVASFTIARNDRFFDKESEEWVDGDPTFLRCSLWREYGENFAESVGKGDRVFVIGKLQQNEFTDKEGNERITL